MRSSLPDQRLPEIERGVLRGRVQTGLLCQRPHFLARISATDGGQAIVPGDRVAYQGMQDQPGPQIERQASLEIGDKDCTPGDARQFAQQRLRFLWRKMVQHTLAEHQIK